ncbi:class I SAM-dependent methyltransferase [Pseudomonas sp. PCH446]
MRNLLPRSLLDVGVGVGLLLRNLAPSVEAYLGIDVSQTALAAAKQSLSTVEHAQCRVELIHGDAGELSSVTTGAADTVVINSVIQYFPSSEYLERVVTEAARVVSPHGQVFIGDVRHLGLLEAFHATVQLEKAAPLTTAAELINNIARNVKEEGELCLAPGHFIELANRLGGFSETRIELKRGHAINELTTFRYDVSLIGRAKPQPHEPGVSRAWGSPEQPASLAALEQSLSRIGQAPLTVTGITNLRLVKPLALLRLLAEMPSSTIAWELQRQLWLVEDPHALNPEDIASLAERMGLEVRLLMPEQERMDRFDAYFSLPTPRTQPQNERMFSPQPCPWSKPLEYVDTNQQPPRVYHSVGPAHPVAPVRPATPACRDAALAFRAAGRVTQAAQWQSGSQTPACDRIDPGGPRHGRAGLPAARYCG